VRRHCQTKYLYLRFSFEGYSDFGYCGKCEEIFLSIFEKVIFFERAEEVSQRSE
jgi:hypothetical protein